MRIVKGRELFTGKWTDAGYMIIRPGQPAEGPFGTLSQARAVADKSAGRKLQWEKLIRQSGRKKIVEYHLRGWAPT